MSDVGVDLGVSDELAIRTISLGNTEFLGPGAGRPEFAASQCMERAGRRALDTRYQPAPCDTGATQNAPAKFGYAAQLSGRMRFQSSDFSSHATSATASEDFRPEGIPKSYLARPLSRHFLSQQATTGLRAIGSGLDIFEEHFMSRDFGCSAVA